MKHFTLLIILLFVFASNSFSITRESQQLTDKQRAQAYFSQGYLYYLEGSFKEAIPEFIKALKCEPNMAKARYWIAKSAIKLGNYRSAVNQCESALKIEPNNKDIIHLRDEADAKLLNRTTPKAKAADQTVSKPTVITKVILKPQKTNLISMDLRNVDISTVLQIFSKETGISIIAGKDVYGKVTVIINNIAPEDALDMILKSNGYTYAREGNVVQVFSSGEPARVEELPGGVFVRTFIINYIGPDELKETLTKLMPESSSIFTTKGSKTIVVRGSANDIKRAEALIRNLDIPPRQVMVEAKIIEVSVNEGQNLGMNYNHTYTNPDNGIDTIQTKGLANAPTITGATGLYYSVTNQNLSYLVEMLSTRTGFNILSSPKVMALNEQQAEIITGSRLGYKVKTVTTTGMIESVEFMDIGTKLVITPSIKSDGLIMMEIHPEISEGAIVNDLPQKNSTETTTQLIVKDGQTIVIGGLIRDTSKKEVKGIPVLMDIPFIGPFFKRTDLTSEKKEVMVLITPHIVTPRLIEEMDSRISGFENKRNNIAPVFPLDLVR
jgi:type II secretory pathway component GspD/PulD (secretin)